MSGDFNNDGISGTGADIVHLISNLSSISSSNDLDGDNSVTQADVTYLANAIVKKTGYTLETGSRNLNNYLLNSPPSVVFGGTYASTANEIYISWSYPTQIEAAFDALYLPFISSITIKIDVYNGSTTSTDNVILNASTGNNYIKYSGATAYSTSPITGLVLSKTSGGSSGYNASVAFPDGVSRPCYLYNNPNLFAALQAHENSKVKIHYSNHNSTAVISEFAYPGFLESGPPSGIQGLTVTFTNDTFKGAPPGNNSTPSYAINLSIQAPQYSDKNNYYTHGDSNGTNFDKFTVTTLTDGICANRFVASGSREDPKMTNIVAANISDISGNWKYNDQYLYNYDASLVTIATPALYNETTHSNGAITGLVLTGESGHIYTDNSVGYSGGNFNTVSLDITYNSGQPGIRPESNYWFNVMVENDATSTLGDSVWCGPYLTPPLAGPDMTTSGFYKGTGQTLSVTFKNGDTPVDLVTVRLASDTNRNTNQKDNVIPKAITKVTFSDSNIPIQNLTSRGTLSLNAYRLVRVQTKLTGGTELKNDLSTQQFNEDNRMHIRGFLNGSAGYWTETDNSTSLIYGGDNGYTQSDFIVKDDPDYKDYYVYDDDHKQGYYNTADISYTIGDNSNMAHYNNNIWTDKAQQSNALYTITQTINQYDNDTDTTASGTKISSTTFYYDSGLTITPTIGGVSQTITSYGTTQTICGVTTTTGSVKLDATVSDVTNLGNYFYNKDQVIKYNDNSNSKHTDPTTITDGVVQSSTFTKGNLLKHPGSGVQTSVGLTVTAYGPTGLTATSTPSTLPIRHDGEGHPSDYRDQFGITGSQSNGNLYGYQTGMRVSSGSPNTSASDNFLKLVPAYAAGVDPTAFNDSADLDDTTAELIIYNGAYRTVGSTSTLKAANGYKNWGGDGLETTSPYSAGSPNYSGLTGYEVNSVKYRFASFAWKIQGSSNSFTKFNFSIQGCTGNISTDADDTNVLQIDSQDLHIFYKTTLDGESGYPGGTTTTAKNGIWVSATRSGAGDFGGFSSANYAGLLTSKVMGGRHASSRNTVTVSGSNKTITVEGQYAGDQAIVDVTDVVVLMRIIVPHDVDFSFKKVQMKLV